MKSILKCTIGSAEAMTALCYELSAMVVSGLRSPDAKTAHYTPNEVVQVLDGSQLAAPW